MNMFNIVMGLLGGMLFGFGMGAIHAEAHYRKELINAARYEGKIQIQGLWYRIQEGLKDAES